MKSGRSGRKPSSEPKASPEKRITSDRLTSRSFVRLPVRITLASDLSTEHIGFVRDISPRGIFFYSDFSVAVGEALVFIVEYTNGEKKTRLELSGKAIRVEQGASKEAIGIAVAFDSVHDEVPRAPLPPKRRY